MRKTAENQICPRVLYMTVAINTKAGHYSFPISNENFIHQFNFSDTVSSGILRSEHSESGKVHRGKF